MVFESGFAASSLNWTCIQEAISQCAHTISYDRYGLVWSSPSSSPGTPTHLAAELRAMLGEVGAEPPFILVGHSFGGLIMQRYSLDFPKEVAGLVLVDPMRTREWPPIDESRCPMVDGAERLARYAIHVVRFGVAQLIVRSLLCGSDMASSFLLHLGGKGGHYLKSRLSFEGSKTPVTIRPAIAAHWSSPKFFQALVAQIEALQVSVTEMHGCESIHGIPVVVLTPASASALEWYVICRFGKDSSQVFAKHSTHWVHLDEPQLVVASILSMIAAVSKQPEDTCALASSGRISQTSES